VFTYGADQARLAGESKARLEKKLGRPVATRVEPAQTFWRAEDYHQQYFDKSSVAACPSR
jgi:peptide-methionine (S)-S-oxide reductase